MIKPSTCKSCQLYEIGNSYSIPFGKGTSGVIILGEALDYEGSLEGTPFPVHAQGGSKLEECIKLAGFKRADFLISNLVRCFPPEGRLSGYWYAAGAIAHCYRTYQKDMIERFIPPAGKRKVILALGNASYQNLTGNFDSVSDIRGYPYSDKYGMGITIIPAIHPSFIKRGQGHLTPLLVEDIKKACTIAGQEEWIVPEGKDKDSNNKIERDIPF
jgi:uracil-DNA glycosylase family 4